MVDCKIYAEHYILHLCLTQKIAILKHTAKLSRFVCVSTKRIIMGFFFKTVRILCRIFKFQ